MLRSIKIYTAVTATVIYILAMKALGYTVIHAKIEEDGNATITGGPNV